MYYQLLTVKDLAERWKKDEGTIRRYVREGVLSPCQGVPGMLFNPTYISKLEGAELERFSPLERKRIEAERDMYKNKYEDMKGIITNVLIEVSKIIKVPREDILSDTSLWK